jgi:aspartate dehydrogenase
MRRVGVIGCGNIGRPVVRALLRGEAGPHVLGGVLARSARDLDGFAVTGDAAAFLDQAYDLVIEAGGPAAFRALVPAALERSEVWAVSPIPLADPAFENEVRRVAAATGHAFRIAPGALAGFDGIAAAMAAGLQRLEVFVDLAAGEGAERELLFEGTARQVAQRFPEGVNVAVAAALAGPGLDATHVRVLQPPRGTRGRTMGFTVRSPAGIVEVTSRPRVAPAEDAHAVAASLIAMLRGTTAGLAVLQDWPPAVPRQSGGSDRPV